MSDEFGTVNLRRGDRTREIEVLRQHRESLVKMLAEVDQQLRELELTAPPPPPSPASHPTHPALRGYEAPDGPASREIVNTTRDYEDTSGVNPGSGIRVVLILAVALVALVLIGWLIWRARSNRSATTSTVVEESTAADMTATASATVVEGETNPAATTAALTIRPSSQDYGLVRKGTRTTRQYEIANNSQEPLSIALARSACRCLYYEHAPVIPPKAKESITVTIDGAKAKAGILRETIRVTAKSDSSVETAFDVTATVQ